MAELSLEGLISRARSLGFQAEVMAVDVSTYELSWEKMSYYGLTYREVGYGVRVIDDQRRLGFAYGNSLTEDLLEMAVRSARAGRPDPHNALPSPEPVTPLEGAYDPALEEPYEVVRGLVNEVLSSRPGNLNIIMTRGWGGTSRVRVVSTEGVDVQQQASFVGLAASANYLSEGYVGPEVYEFVDSRTVKGISAEALVKELHEKVSMTSSRRREDLRGRPIVLTPKAVNELLFPLLNHAVSLENVYRGKSPLRPGEDLGSKVSVTDDPRLPGGAWSRAFDGEGLPARAVNVMASGVFRTALSNTYWSARAGAENTHSSWRTYMTLPAISATYMVVEAPPLSDVGDAVVVDQVEGVHTSNFDTGEFSVTASVAWDGKGGLREFVLSGDLRSLLRGIAGAAGERKRYGRMVSAPLLVQGLRVSS